VLYQPLQKDELEIRLLAIHPCDKDGRIECSLYHSHLHEDLKFKALSYVRGDPTKTEEIIINGHITHVGTNLASALRHILATGASNILKTLWTDAIYINQKDIKERGHQVQLMGTLYSYATLAISWLGLEAENTTFALELVPRVTKAIRDAEDAADLEWLHQFPEIWDHTGDIAARVARP
jgi:hypothetical protein